ncbi:hypothetical protein ABPG72_013973 [Tetrahymena utriculariae]
MGQNKSKQKIEYIAEPLQIEAEPQQKYVIFIQGKEYNLKDYFDLAEIQTSQNTCQSMLRYLIKKGLEVSKDSIALYMNDAVDYYNSIKNFLDKINYDKCYFIMMYQREFDLQIGIVDAIQQCKHLVKISIQFYHYNKSIYQLSQLFGQVIDYYQQSNYLQDVYFQIQYNTIKIDSENKNFQIDLFSQLILQEDDYQPINVFPLKSKCKFRNIWINVYPEILKNRVNSIIDFLQNNQQELQKLQLILFRYYQQDEIERVLKTITQINQQYKILEGVNISMSQRINEIQFDIYEYVMQNQNLDNFMINNIGIQGNHAIIHFELNNSMVAQLIIQKIIQKNAKIQVLKLQNGLLLQGQFLQNFEVEISRRIKLQVELGYHALTQQEYLKLLKQLSYFNQLEHQNNTFKYTFLSFYIIERFVCFFSIYANLLPPIFETILIALLNPVYLEEFYLLIRGDKYPRYQSEGIDGQAFVISVLSVPNYILVLIWTFYYPETINIVFTALALLALISGQFFICYLVIYHRDTVVNIQNPDTFYLFLKEISLTGIHFLSYVALLCVNFHMENFLYYLITFEVFLIIYYITQIKTRIQDYCFSSIEAFGVCFVLVCKEILHLVVDLRDLSDNLQKHSIQSYGLNVYNNMLLFGFLIETYLFTMFNIFLYEQNLFHNINLFYILLYILSIISCIILGSRVFQYILWPAINGRKFIEFNSIDSFIKYSKNKSNTKLFEKLETTLLLCKQSNLTQDFIFEVFYGYSKSQIISKSICRENIKKSQYQQQKVCFYEHVNISNIIEIIGQYGRILPQIKEIQFLQNGNKDEYDLYRAFSECNIFVQLSSISDVFSDKLARLNSNTVQQIKVIINQFFILNSKKYEMLSQQLTNPQYISYDLFDEVN